MVWERFRLRRFKSELMREAAYKGMLAVLEPRRRPIPERTSSYDTVSRSVAMYYKLRDRVGRNERRQSENRIDFSGNKTSEQKRRGFKRMPGDL